IFISTYLNFFMIFMNATAYDVIYTLSLHDALPIYLMEEMFLALKDRAVQLLKGFKGDDYTFGIGVLQDVGRYAATYGSSALVLRSEEHTSELQSRENLVCRLLLEKKNKNIIAVYCN